MNFGSGSAKAWRDIWGAGQGVGLMDDVPTVAEMVARLKAEYEARRAGSVICALAGVEMTR